MIMNLKKVEIMLAVEGARGPPETERDDLFCGEPQTEILNSKSETNSKDIIIKTRTKP